MDFIIELPITKKHNDTIMVMIEKRMKETHFIPVKSTYKAINIVDILMKEIFRMHGLPKEIIFNRDTKFTSNFWKTLFSGMNT